MPEVFIRRAGPADRVALRKSFDAAPDPNAKLRAIFLAEDQMGNLLGAQWLCDMPRNSARIATIINPGKLALRVGSALFDGCRRDATGLSRLVAILPITNEGAGIYYQSHGFELIARNEGQSTFVYRLK